MNFNKYKKIIRQMRKISLSSDDKKTMRREFMMESGIDKELSDNFINNLFVVPFYASRYKMIPISVAIILFLVVAPLTYASEISLPGDFLYPIKTVINDPIKRVINNKVLKKDSVDFEFNLLEEKIIETEKIIEKDELDDNRKSKAKEVISKQIKKVKDSGRAEEALKKVADKLELNLSNKSENPEDVKDIPENKFSSEQVPENLIEPTESKPESLFESEKEKEDKNSKKERTQNEHSNSDEIGREEIKEVESTINRDVDRVLEKHKEVLEKIGLPKTNL